MKRLVLAVCLVGFSVAVIAPGWARDVVVLLHNHSFYSDGFDSPTEVCRKAFSVGAEVVAINDHAELVEETSLPEYFGLRKNHFGFDDWTRDLDLARQYCERMGKKLIYGAEIGIGTNRHNHLLVFFPPEMSKPVDLFRAWCEFAKNNSPDNNSYLDVIDKLRLLLEEHGVVFAAAHPTHGMYPFNYGWVVNVYETFNHFRDNGSTFDYIAANAGSPPAPKAIVAGSDYHYEPQSEHDKLYSLIGLGESYWPSLQRFTIVQADDTSATAVLDAIGRCRCYAAFRDARITRMSCWPGDGVMDSNKPLGVEVSGLATGISNHANDFSEANAVYVLAVSAKDGSSLRWQAMMHREQSRGGVYIDLSPLRGKGRWWVYVDIARQIMTSAIEVESGVTTDQPHVATVQPAETAPQPMAVSSPAGFTGSVFKGSTRFADATVTATYFENGGGQGGLLELRFDPPGSVYKLDVRLVPGTMARPDHAEFEKIPLDHFSGGRCTKCFSEGRLQEVGYSYEARWYVLACGYAYPEGTTTGVQAAMNNIGGTPKINLMRVQ